MKSVERTIAGLLKLGPSSLAWQLGTDAESVTVRVAEVELADVPRLVRRWMGNRHPVRKGQRVGRVHIGRRRQEPAHPHAAGVVVSRVPRQRTAARTLRPQAQKNLHLVAANRAEDWIFMVSVPTVRIADFDYGRQSLMLALRDLRCQPRDQLVL